jgi:hypothetical protein
MASTSGVADDQDIRPCLPCRPVQHQRDVPALDEDFDIRANLVLQPGDLFRSAPH